MSVFILKCLAVLTMVIDHVGYVISLATHQTGQTILLMRSVGRLALPVFAFLIVNGFDRSSDRKAYLTRLCGFALISQIPFTLAFTQHNYMSRAFRGFEFSLTLAEGWIKMLPLILAAALVYYLVVCRGKWDRKFPVIMAFLILPLLSLKLAGISVTEPHLNVFYTLAVSLAMLCAIDGLMKNDGSYSPVELALLAAGAAAAALFILPSSDYGYKGLVLITALYLSRRYRLAQCAVLIIWSLWMYSYYTPFFIGAAAACLPVLLYNGKKGPAFKLGFYLIYPVHLFILFYIGIFIQ